MGKCGTESECGGSGSPCRPGMDAPQPASSPGDAPAGEKIGRFPGSLSGIKAGRIPGVPGRGNGEADLLRTLAGGAGAGSKGRPGAGPAGNAGRRARTPPCGTRAGSNGGGQAEGGGPEAGQAGHGNGQPPGESAGGGPDGSASKDPGHAGSGQAGGMQSQDDAIPGSVIESILGPTDLAAPGEGAGPERQGRGGAYSYEDFIDERVLISRDVFGRKEMKIKVLEVSDEKAPTSWKLGDRVKVDRILVTIKHLETQQVEECEFDIGAIEREIARDRHYSSTNRWVPTTDIKNGYVTGSRHTSLISDAVALEYIAF